LVGMRMAVDCGMSGLGVATVVERTGWETEPGSIMAGKLQPAKVSTR
jgi:hypothetical protein